MSISALCEDADRAERGGADQEQLPPPDPVAKGAHRHEEARDHEPVDVDDPEELGAARVEVLADRRHREVEDRQVHHVEQAGEGEDGQADPLAPAGAAGRRGGVRGRGRHRGSSSLGVDPSDRAGRRNSSLDLTR
jgi:hypothetical protein